MLAFSLSFFLITDDLCPMQAAADTTGTAIRQNLNVFQRSHYSIDN